MWSVKKWEKLLLLKVKSVLHDREGQCTAAPPTFSHIDGEGAERPEDTFKEPRDSSMLPSVTLGLRFRRQLHCLDLLTCLQQWIRGTIDKNSSTQSGGGGGKLENKWLFLVEDGVLIGEAEASGEAGERARKKYYLRLKMDPWLIPLSELNTPKMLWGEQEYWRRGGGEERRQEEVVRKRGQAVPVSSSYRPVSVQGQAAADYCWCPHVSPNQDN